MYDELIDILGSDSKSYITVTQINELKYLDIVVKEALRIYPPVPLIERSLEEDCIVGRYFFQIRFISTKTKLLL